MRRVVSESLRKDGYDVIAVSDGGRLLVALTRELIQSDGRAIADLVVSDIRLPIRTGMRVLEELRAARWRVPVILMTAFGDDATRERARRLRAVLFDKPFDLEDLRVAVATLLRRAA